MTKSDECAYWQELVDGLPNNAWYLRSILGDIRGAVGAAILNDFGFVDWSVHCEKQKEMQTEIVRLQTHKAQLVHEINQLQRTQGHALDQLEQMRGIVRDLSKKL